MAEKIIKVASFPYQGKDGIERTALRGEKVDITDGADLERGERLDVFATGADLQQGTVFGDFYVAKEANRKAAADAGMPGLAEEPVVTQPELNRLKSVEKEAPIENEFEIDPPDDTEDDVARNSRLTQVMQGMARQVSLDPGDGMEL